MNYSDAERIISFLESSYITRVPEERFADLLIFITCGVRQSAEDKAVGQIKNIRRLYPNKKIILTGCLASRKEIQKKLAKQVDLFTPIDFFPKKISFYLRKTFNINYCSSNLPQNYLNIIPNYNQKHIAYIPIMTGCNNFCSYCVVPFARGREHSRSPQEIIKEVKKAVQLGVKEIILIGQNVNSFRWTNTKTKSKKNEITFVKLIKMINNLSGNFWLGFLTNHPKDMGDDIIKTMVNYKKINPYLSLPVQSGSNIILKKMKRGYRVSDYIRIVDKIRNLYKKKRKDVRPAISTDLIVGFPGESNKHFQETVKLMKKIKFDMAYIAQYSPRPETAAYKLKDNVSKKIKERRAKKLTQILKKTALSNNRNYLGKDIDVLVDKILSIDQGSLFTYLGHTQTQKKVTFRSSNKDLIGKIVKINVEKVLPFGLKGRII